MSFFCKAVGQENFILNKFLAPFLSSIFLLFPRKQFVAFSFKTQVIPLKNFLKIICNFFENAGF